jgi:hypothetical protein
MERTEFGPGGAHPQDRQDDGVVESHHINDHEGKGPAPSLDELRADIIDNLRQGHAAARAAMPFFLAAGQKLNEARARFGTYAEFVVWVKTSFKVSSSTADVYMRLAKECANSRPLEFDSLADFLRKIKPPKPEPPEAPPIDVDEMMKRAAERDQRDEATIAAEREREERSFERQQQRAQERKRKQERQQRDINGFPGNKASRDLALELIAAGYKQLAKNGHPDAPGGSTERMTLLNNVRDYLVALFSGGRR